MLHISGVANANLDPALESLDNLDRILRRLKNGRQQNIFISNSTNFKINFSVNVKLCDFLYNFFMTIFCKTIVGSGPGKIVRIRIRNTAHYSNVKKGYKLPCLNPNSNFAIIFT